MDGVREVRDPENQGGKRKEEIREGKERFAILFQTVFIQMSQINKYIFHTLKELQTAAQNRNTIYCDL